MAKAKAILKRTRYLYNILARDIYDVLDVSSEDSEGNSSVQKVHEFSDAQQIISPFCRQKVAKFPKTLINFVSRYYSKVVNENKLLD